MIDYGSHTLAALKLEQAGNTLAQYGARCICVIHCGKCSRLIWVREGSVRSSLCGTLHGHELSTNNPKQCCNCPTLDDEDVVDITGGPSTTFGYGAEIWVTKQEDQ